MNTFLPYESYYDSARSLDTKRLNNQINEALIILRTLTGHYSPKKGWPNHPITRAWKGYEDSLAQYAIACINTLENRTNKSQGHRVTAIYAALGHVPILRNIRPWWTKDRRTYSCYRAVLLTKGDWYKQFEWEEERGGKHFYHQQWFLQKKHC